MKNISLNEEQKEILSWPSSLVVLAGAGTGKTATMVEKYVSLLGDEKKKISADQIVAITFTRKAAAELASRIRWRLSMEVERRKSSGQNYLRLARELDRLPVAPISTIDSFALKLVISHPVEAGLLTTLPEIASQANLAEMRARALAALFRDEEISPELARLLTFIELEGVRRLMDCLFARGIDSEELLELIGKTGEEMEARVRETLVGIARYRLKRAGESPTFMSALNAIEVFAKKMGEESTSARKAEAFVRRFFKALSTLDPFLLVTREACEERKNIRWGSNNKETQQVFKKLLYFLEELEKVLPVPSPLDEEHRMALDALSKVYSRAWELFTLECSKNGVHDFVQIQKLARGLLSKAVRHPDGGCELFGQIYRYVIVDEFQDTNPLQFSLIEPLWRNGAELIVVGDVKQSIYLFRDADPSTFNRISREFHKLELRSNYRTLAVPLKFINRFFEKVFESEISDGKNASGIPDTAWFVDPPPQELLLKRMEEKGNGAGSVELILSEGDGTVDELAKLILKKVKEGYGYGDIAVLMRSLNGVDRYLEVFARYGIPTSLIKAGGFFERIEIRDLVNLLTFLTRPADRFYLAGVLRSPLFSITDSSLMVVFMHLRKSGERFIDTTLDEAGWETMGIPPDEAWRLVRAGEKLRSWCALARDLTASATVARVIEESEARLIYGAGENGIQALENIDRLVDIAYDFSLKGENSLPGLILALEAMGEWDEEGDVPLDPAGLAAVKFMSIHSSKGLEFPVVCVAELGRRFNFRLEGNVRVIRELGIALDIENAADRKDSPFVWDGLARVAEYSGFLESKRLLYVAMTRARDHLILEGRVAPEPEHSLSAEEKLSIMGLEAGRSWAEWMLFLLDIPRGELSAGLRKVKKIGDAEYILNVPHSETPSERKESLTSIETCPDIKRIVTASAGIPVSPELERIITCSFRGGRSLTINASMLNLFLENQEEFISKYLMMTAGSGTGLKDSISDRAIMMAVSDEQNPLRAELTGGPFNGRGNEMRNERYRQKEAPSAEWKFNRLYPEIEWGVLVHRCMEFAAGDIEPSEVASFVLRECECSGERRDELETNLIEVLKKFRDSEVAALLSKPHMREVPFKLYYQQDNEISLMLTGIFDLVVREGKKYKIIDYKTSMPAKNEENIAGRHRLQLAFYSYAASKLFDTSPDNIDSFLLYTRDFSLIRVRLEEEYEVIEKSLQYLRTLLGKI